MGRHAKIVNLNVALPKVERDAINRGAALRDFKQDEYLLWAVKTAEAAAPALGELDALPVSKSVRKQFDDAFRPVLEKHKEGATVEERLAAVREVLRGLLAAVEKHRLQIRAIAAGERTKR